MKKIFKNLKMTCVFQHHVTDNASCSVSPGGGDSKTGEVRVQGLSLFIFAKLKIKVHTVLNSFSDMNQNKRYSLATVTVNNGISWACGQRGIKSRLVWVNSAYCKSRVQFIDKFNLMINHNEDVC